MDDGRGARVQEVKPFEDLTTPALQQLQLHLLEPLQVAETQEEEQAERSSLNMSRQRRRTGICLLGWQPRGTCREGWFPESKHSPRCSSSLFHHREETPTGTDTATRPTPRQALDQQVRNEVDENSRLERA